jgi:hypothetical protein
MFFRHWLFVVANLRREKFLADGVSLAKVCVTTETNRCDLESSGHFAAIAQSSTTMHRDR